MTTATTKKKISRKFWENILKNISLPTKIDLENFEVPSNKHLVYKKKSGKIAKEIRQALKSFSKIHSIPLSALIHSAFGLLLNRFSGLDNIVYGFSLHDNNSLLDSILPKRSTISDKETILYYIKQTSQFLKEYKKYQKYFINVNKKKDKIFNYLLLLPNKKNIKKNVTSSNIKKYSLILKIKNLKKMDFDIIYKSNKFSPKIIQSLIQHLNIIFIELIRDPDQLTTHFPILTPDEKKYLLSQKNRQTLTLNTEYCVHDIFSMNAGKLPHHLAIKDSNQILTYQQLEEKSNQMANLLRAHGIKPNDPIVVFMERTPKIMIAMLATFKVGAIYVPINPKYPEERTRFIITDCNAKVILTDNKEHIPNEFSEKILVYNETSDLSVNNLNLKISPENIAYIIYTSGTTGQPKGVMIKHLSLINFCTWYKKCFKLTSKDRASQFASQGFDPFFCETLPFLYVGGSIHIIGDHCKLNPSIFLKWLVKEKITVCDLPTAYAQILFNLNWPLTLNLRLLKVGGELLPRYPNKKFSFDIWNTYGPTETTIETTYIKIIRANILLKKDIHEHKTPPIGKLIPNSEYYIVDSHLELVPNGCIGELLIGGINVSPGYYNRPELTKEKFIKNIFNPYSPFKLYRTGDLVRILSDGNLEFIGRIDHQVKIRGYRIELSEVETAIANYPDVKEVIVLAKESLNGQKTLIAYLVPNLNKLRIPYAEPCLLESEGKIFQLMTEDISKGGLAVKGLTRSLKFKSLLRINLKLPGSADKLWLTGCLAWQKEDRAGIQFSETTEQKLIMQKCIDYYLSTHNLMETLQSAATKRSIKMALRGKLPDYMIPSIFSVLPEFPLTFNGKIDWKALPPPQDFERLLEHKIALPRTLTEKVIANIWRSLLNKKQISITDNFFDLGGTSLMVAELAIKLFEKFNIHIPNKIFIDLPYIPVLAEYIDSKGKQYTKNSLIQKHIRRDSILNENLVPNNNLSKKLSNPKNILLTGSAGFLGIYLLRELLKLTKANIYCLVRKSHFDSLEKHFLNNVNKFYLSKEIQLTNKRIILITSDIGLNQFGIPSEQYNQLATKINLIIHCGAQVNTMTSYSNLRSSNVLGTIEILKFAIHKIDKPIHYISTLSSAYKKNKEGDFVEEFPNGDFSQLVGGYAMSKWVSERLLTQIKQRGLPVNIYRCGYILGDSISGITNTNDSLLFLIKGCLQLGYAPRWKENIAILPVDFVSQAIVKIATMQGKDSAVFHLDNPCGILWLDLINWFKKQGYSIRWCSHKKWLSYLKRINKENALYPFLSYYLSMTDEPKTPKTHIINTVKIFQKIKLVFPQVNDLLLKRYLNYLQKIEFFPKP